MLLDIDAGMVGVRFVVHLADWKRINRHTPVVCPARLAGVESIRSTDSLMT